MSPLYGAARPDESWEFRPVAGANAAKAYRCPGCDHEIGVGSPHLVAWPPDTPDERRHWHTACWRQARR